MRAALPWLLAIGCGFSPGAGAIDAPTDPDATDRPDGCHSFSSQLDTCAITPYGGALVITGPVATYDTSTGTLTDDGVVSHPAHRIVAGPAGMIDVLLVDSFEIAAGAELRVTGTRAFGVVSPGVIEIEGLADLVGPAAGSRTDALCAASAGMKGMNDNGGAGGGGGGGFQGAGGMGGPGDRDNGSSRGGDAGVMIALPAGPIGGCDGGPGGDDSNTQGGAAGDGGGAVLLASGTSITIGAAGVINVGGGGGSRGGDLDDGGGGGGSGGMMLLESKLVIVHGVLAANGGGGGEGAGGDPGQAGQASASAAQGGSNDPVGGDGASGGALGSQMGGTAIDLQDGGGGGGGGGVGYIAIACPAPMTGSGTISPAFTPWP
jgi:hypothetical protein